MRFSGQVQRQLFVLGDSRPAHQGKSGTGGGSDLGYLGVCCRARGHRAKAREEGNLEGAGGHRP